MFAEPETWVAVAFVILMGVFAYLGVHRTVLKALDNRSQRIKAELDDARRLKDEATKVLGEYKARRASAEREAQEIIAGARAEAERIATEAKAKMEDFMPGAPRPPRARSRWPKPGAGRCPRGRGRRCGEAASVIVADGEGKGRRRPVGQGHRRGPPEAELEASVHSPNCAFAPAFSCDAEPDVPSLEKRCCYLRREILPWARGASACGSKPI